MSFGRPQSSDRWTYTAASNEELVRFIYRHLEAGTFRKDVLEVWLRERVVAFEL